MFKLFHFPKRASVSVLIDFNNCNKLLNQEICTSQISRIANLDNLFTKEQKNQNEKRNKEKIIIMRAGSMK